MRILLVHDYGTATGGAELQMLTLREKLRERGHDARLLTSRARLVPSELLADYNCFGTTARLQVLSQTFNPSAYLRLHRVLSEFHPDVVHVRMFMWQLSPLILPLLRDVPSLYQAAVYKSICPRGTKILPDGTPCHDPAGVACLVNGCLTPQTWVLLMFQMKLWQRWRHVFDSVVALSEAMKTKLEAQGIGPIEVVYNGVPERPMRPQLSHPPVLAFAGRLAPEKGINVLLQALAKVAKKVPEVQLLIAGEGPERERIIKLIEQLRLSSNVILLGHLSRPELEQRFDTPWVQVAPSLWEEPFGNVATEAMMRGTAVVASDVGGLAEIVENEKTGFLVPPGNADALAATLLRLLNDKELAERMGLAGRYRALSHFSEARCVDSFVQIYQRLCK